MNQLLEIFRTYGRLDLVLGVEHPYRLIDPGDLKRGDRATMTRHLLKKSYPSKEDARTQLEQKGIRMMTIPVEFRRREEVNDKGEGDASDCHRLDLG